MSEYLTLEEDLKYQLSTLASYVPDDIDNPQFEVGYESESGHEGFLDVCCVDVGYRALKRILKLERDNDRLTAHVEELKAMLSRFLPANDYACDEGEFNLGGDFLYDDGSEDIGFEVHELLTRIGEDNE